jgi:hypothetical protein
MHMAPRLRAATSWLGDNSISFAMMTIGETLLQYPKLPASKRTNLPALLEKDSERLLERVRQLPIRG